MQLVALNKIRGAKGLFAKVDDDIYSFLNTFNWYAREVYNLKYATCNFKKEGKYQPMQMHRLIMSAEKGQMIDHIDGDGLNNQRSNLRFCTNSQNIMNSRSCVDSTSKYKGVRLLTNNNKQKNGEINTHTYFVAQITYNKNQIHIGSFKDEIAAALAYNKKAVELFGDFARLNII